jgi:class 3 adenylate cyclase
MSPPAAALPDPPLSAARPEFNDRAMHLISTGNPERTHATVLFVDVEGSMDLTRSLELDEWWSTIAELFELMCEGVYRFGGWVGGFTGDGITALFESQPATSDHARRACDAALWLREAVRTLAIRLHREYGFELAIRIGLNSGEVLTGAIGGRYRRHLTAAGYAVGLAKRMESIAEAGHICISENTAALVERHLAVRALGAVDVKGAPGPVSVFELLGSGPRTPTGADARSVSDAPIAADGLRAGARAGRTRERSPRNTRPSAGRHEIERRCVIHAARAPEYPSET